MGKDKKIKKKNSKASTLKKVLLYVGKYKWLVALSILLALGVVGLTLLIPVLVGDAIDGIVGKGDVNFDLIKKIILIIAAAVAGVSIFTERGLQHSTSLSSKRLGDEIDGFRGTVSHADLVGADTRFLCYTCFECVGLRFRVSGYRFAYMQAEISLQRCSVYPVGKI